MSEERRFKFKRTLTAPLLVFCCYIALALSSLIDPDSLATKDNIYLSVIVLQMLIFLIPGIIYCKMRGKRCITNLCIKKFGPRKILFSVFSFFTLTSGAALIKLALYEFGFFSTSYTLYADYIPSDTASFTGIVYIIMALAVLPAVTEEFIFRGVVLQEYRLAGCSKTASVILSALLFAMLHFNMGQLPVYFFAGIVLSSVMIVTESLPATILVHFLNNAFSLFFETTLLRFISQADSAIFVMFFFAVLFLVFLILALHEAEHIVYDTGMNGADPMFGIPSKKHKTHYSALWLEAIISPTFLLCIAAFVVKAFGLI
ncbi:MAG: CPBP family intramembrane metalloprotease [Clostridia bacterium]|nr:CPBP family intramembrane metalloprotease [Clostridia bacterium]